MGISLIFPHTLSILKRAKTPILTEICSPSDHSPNFWGIIGSLRNGSALGCVLSKIHNISMKKPGLQAVLASWFLSLSGSRSDWKWAGNRTEKQRKKLRARMEMIARSGIEGILKDSQLFWDTSSIVQRAKSACLC